MARLLGPFLVLGIQVLGSFLIGCWLLLTPTRAGNQLHDAFLVFPPVGPRDRTKKLCLRVLGCGLIGIAVKAALGVVHAVQ